MTNRQDLKSKRLTAILAEARRPIGSRAATRRLVVALSDPCNWRKPVYAWLLANHDRVLVARTSWNGLGWEEIADVMTEDGILGSHGAPPNANSVRRVWGRVVRDKEKRDAWDAEQAG